MRVASFEAASGCAGSPLEREIRLVSFLPISVKDLIALRYGGLALT